jgi:hypothetical protein
MRALDASGERDFRLVASRSVGWDCLRDFACLRDCCGVYVQAFRVPGERPSDGEWDAVS